MNREFSSPDLIHPAILRILDANLDRSREGLRIVEEWCRFGLNDSSMANECKHLRQELATWHTPEMRLARDTSGDVGTELSHPGEETRQDLNHLLQANLCRVQEALRVIEEYGKLYQPQMSTASKQMRYRVYSLETSLLSYHRRQILARAALYLVTSPVPNLIQRVEMALQGGLKLVQYRDKNGEDRDRLANAQQLRQICDRYGALLIINDRIDLAVAVDADGIHLGQQDLPIALARRVLGANKIIGQSTTNPDEMRRSIEQGADYIGVGPVHETPTKAGKAAAGLDYVKYAAQHASIPWFAIGGIEPRNLAEVMAAGASRVAVVRSIMEAEHPTVAVQHLQTLIDRHRLP
jgi:thiamine-phosphate pyrophosphorylase